QADTAVSRHADRVVLLLQPETGDDLQWEKAGVLEVANIIVIHKGDLPGAERTLAQVKASVEMSAQRDVPVLLVSSRTGDGVAELWQTLEESPSRQTRGDELAGRLREDFERRLRGLTREPAYRTLQESLGAGDENATLREAWRLLLR